MLSKEDVQKLFDDWNVVEFFDDTEELLDDPKYGGRELLIGSDVCVFKMCLEKKDDQQKRINAEIKICGEIRIVDKKNGDVYKDGDQKRFPDDLVEVIKTGELFYRSDKYRLDDSNWYDIYIEDERGKCLENSVIDRPKKFDDNLRRLLVCLESCDVKINWDYLREGNFEKKYELVKDISHDIKVNENFNYTVYRIRALKDFEVYNGNKVDEYDGDLASDSYWVNKGDLGGWIESEDNLSQLDSCWVADDAMVYGNAKVSRCAVVKDEALVRGSQEDSVEVTGTTLVEDRAVVAGSAKVDGYSFIWGNARVEGHAIISESGIGDDAYVAGDTKLNDCAVRGRTMLFEGSYNGETIDRTPSVKKDLEASVDKMNRGSGVRNTSEKGMVR